MRSRLTLMAPDAAVPRSRRGVRGIPVTTRGLGYVSPAAAAAQAAAEAAAAAAAGPARSPTERVLRDTESAVQAIRDEVRQRIDGGQLYRLDGKAGCNAGPWGNNYSMMKTNDWDPVWCLRDRDKTMPPVLRFDIACSSVPQLFWPDLYERARGLIRTLLTVEPRETVLAAVRAKWTRTVLELSSIAIEATNIQPLFLFPALWAQTRPFKATGADGQLVNWGLYSSAFTQDGQTQPNLHAGGYMTPRYGAGLPRTIIDYNNEKANAVARRLGLAAQGEIPPSGVHYSRESTGLVKAPVLGLASMAGCNLTTNSQYIRAMREGIHDPWASDFGDSDGPLLTEAMLRRSGGSATATSRGAVITAMRRFKTSWARYFVELFETSQGRPAGLDEGYDPYKDKAAYIPNSQWWVGLAARWGRTIRDRAYDDIFMSSLAFYLVNHTAYFERLLGAAAPLTTREASTILDTLRYAKSQMPAMGHAMGAALISTAVGGGVVGAVTGVVQSVAQGVQDEASRLYHNPELPKPLFKRIARDSTCGGEGGSGAAESILPFIFPETSRDEDLTSTPSKIPKPVLVGGALLIAGAAAYFLLR